MLPLQIPPTLGIEQPKYQYNQTLTIVSNSDSEDLAASTFTRKRPKAPCGYIFYSNYSWNYNLHFWLQLNFLHPNPNKEWIHGDN